MIKSQTIFLDRTPYNIQSGSLIFPDTEILNIIIDDGTPQTDCQLIGGKMEYKPLVWLEHERQTIFRLKELNFIFLTSKASDKLKTSIKNLYPHILVNFYQTLLYSAFGFYEKAKKYATNLERPREKNCYLSIGTMRLPRFYLAWYCQRVGIHNFGCPRLADNLLDDFMYQLEKMSGVKLTFQEYKNTEKRFFADVSQRDFEKKQMNLLSDSRINIVSHYPFYDYITHFYDEKLSLPIRAKTIPFFIDNKGANDNIRDLGFKSYVGFDYSAEHMDNFVERWETLLQNNKKFFLEEKKSKEIYDMNKNIIDNNYQVLIETNWREKALAEFLQLPGHIRDAVENNTNLI